MHHYFFHFANSTIHLSEIIIVSDQRLITKLPRSLGKILLCLTFVYNRADRIIGTLPMGCVWPLILVTEGTRLRWFGSFLSDRSKRVVLLGNHPCPSACLLACVVPLRCQYCLPRYFMSAWSYAGRSAEDLGYVDNTTFYLMLPSDPKAKVATLNQCLEKVMRSMRGLKQVEAESWKDRGALCGI